MCRVGVVGGGVCLGFCDRVVLFVFFYFVWSFLSIFVFVVLFFLSKRRPPSEFILPRACSSCGGGGGERFAGFSFFSSLRGPPGVNP